MGLKGTLVSVFTWVFLSVTHLWAQNSSLDLSRYSFQYISVDQGLSQANVNAIYLDEAGYLWFGTEDGLNRYDGYDFTVFRYEPNSESGLSGNMIFDINGTSGTGIWVATNGGVTIIEQDGSKLISKKPEFEGQTILQDMMVTSLFSERDSIIWVGTNGRGLYRVNNSTGDNIYKLRHYGFSDWENLLIQSVFRDGSGILWIGTRDGLFRVNEEDESLIQVLLNEDKEQEHERWIKDIHEDVSGNLWALSESVLWLIDKNNRSAEKFAIGNQQVRSNRLMTQANIVEDVSYPGNLWIPTQYGLFYYNQTDRSISQQNLNSETRKTSSSVIGTLYMDHSGMFWIAERLGGLTKVDLSSPRILHLSHDSEEPNSLSQNDVFSMLEDPDGRIWAGTNNGISIYDRESEEYTFLKNDPEDTTSLSHTFVLDMVVDLNNTIWVSSNNILHRYNPEQNNFKRFEFTRITILSMEIGNNGNIWIGTGNGFFSFDPETESETQYESVTGSITGILEDEDGTLWLSCNGCGLLHYNPVSDSLERYRHDPEDDNSISHNSTFAPVKTEDGSVWIATYGGGLNRFDPKSETFKVYTAGSHGLPTNSLDSMLKDEEGNLWIGTDNGLVWFDPQTEQIRVFDPSHGLQSREFHQLSQYKSNKGELFFGGVNGLNAFYQEELMRINSVPPKIRIEEISISGTDSEPISESVKGGAFLFSHDENDLSITYTGLHYKNPEGIIYKYMLEPYDSEWRDAGTRRSTNYTNLDPGEYSFKVKAANSDGIWNEIEASLLFKIKTPWWETWWAISIYGFLFVSLIYGLRRYEMSRIALRNKLELEQLEASRFKELDQMKSRFFANISHEFRTPLTIVLGEIHAVLEKEISDPLKNKLNTAKRNANQLLSLVTQLLDLSKLESREMKLNPVRTDAIPFLKNLFFSFESLADEKSITLSFNSEQDIISFDFEPEKLEIIVINLISNAIKFTREKGEVSLNVRLNEDKVQIHVKDSGIGIPEEKLPTIFNRFYQVENEDTRAFEGTGIGLALVKELVQLYKGEIKVESMPGKGTSFYIQLPVSQNRLVKENHSIIHPNYVSDDSQPVKDESVHINAELSPEKPLVLVVEDNADLRNFIHSSLEEEFNVMEAENGELGLKQAKEAIPDIVISDVMMPVMDGYTFSAYLKEHEKTSHIPIVMLTAKAAHEDKMKGLKAGVDDYLIKPFNKEELLTRISNLLEIRKQLQKKYSTSTIIHPSEINEESLDDKFLKRVVLYIEENIPNELFGVPDLAGYVAMSETQLHRKLKAIVDQPPGQLIRVMRLQRAADLLVQSTGSISEIAYQTGFSDQANFTRSFKKHFGVSPSKYVENISDNIPET